MIVCPSCQKVNAGNPPRCEFCFVSFARLSDAAKATAVANARKNTRMTKHGLIAAGVFMATAVVCNLPASVTSGGLLVGCVIYGAVMGFPCGYALSVINADLKKGAILGAVTGVIFGLILSMMAKESVVSVAMLKGICSGAIGGLVAAAFIRRPG